MDNNSIAYEQAQPEIYKAGNVFVETYDEIILEVEHLIIKLKEAIGKN